jgi:PEP-CTERM motif
MRSSLRLLVSVAALGIAVSLPRQAMAQLAISGTATGNQAWAGTLGQAFTLSSSLAVDILGAFDDGGNGFAAGTTINVAILTSAGASTGLSANFTSGSAGILAGNFRQKTVSPVTLNAGSYVLVGWGYNSTDQNFNTLGAATPFTFNSFSGRATYGNSLFVGTPNTLPNIVDPPTGRYGFATFGVSGSIAPEPGTLVLLSLGALAGIVARRRRA